MYEKKISRAEPGLICFLLDDSGSMAETLPQTSDAKFLWTERLLGICLKELLSRSTEVVSQTARIKPRYHVLVISYGSSPQIWQGGILDIQAAVEKYAEAGSSLGLGGNLGGTDAKAGMQLALDLLRPAITDPRFHKSFPPMLFHLTDGMSATDPTAEAELLKQQTTADGNLLVVNAYIGTETNLAYTGPADFPGYVDAAEAGDSPDNLTMFNMSSVVPDCMRQNLIGDGIFPNLRTSSRLFFDVRTKEMLKHTIQVVGSLGSRADRQGR